MQLTAELHLKRNSIDAIWNDGRCSVLKWSNSTTLGVDTLKMRWMQRVCEQVIKLALFIPIEMEIDTACKPL